MPGVPQSSHLVDAIDDLLAFAESHEFLSDEEPNVRRVFDRLDSKVFVEAFKRQFHLQLPRKSTEFESLSYIGKTNHPGLLSRGGFETRDDGTRTKVGPGFDVMLIDSWLTDMNALRDLAVDEQETPNVQELVSKSDLDAVVVTAKFKTVQDKAGKGGLPEAAGKRGNAKLFDYGQIRKIYLSHYPQSKRYLPESFSEFQECLTRTVRKD